MNTNDLLPVIAEVAENLAFLLPMGTCEPPPPDATTMCVCISYSTTPDQQSGHPGYGGVLHLALTHGAAQATARGMLGLMDDEPPSQADLNDSACELANVLLGNLLPRHYGDTVEFHLGQPETGVTWHAEAPWIALDLGDGILSVALEEAHTP
jgi:hypothetical protein